MNSSVHKYIAIRHACNTQRVSLIKKRVHLLGTKIPDVCTNDICKDAVAGLNDADIAIVLWSCLMFPVARCARRRLACTSH